MAATPTSISTRTGVLGKTTVWTNPTTCNTVIRVPELTSSRLLSPRRHSPWTRAGRRSPWSVFRELYVTLTLAALNTSRVRLGPLVTNPLTRHLVVTASAIASVDEVSGGRAVLGIGSGDSAISTVGAPPATVAGLEDSIVTLGRLTSGALVERDGMRWQVHRSTRRVPVYLAAEGPRTLELAGRVADGVIVGLGLTPDVIRLSLAAVERGARAGGRTLGDLDVWWFAKSNVADTRAEAVAPITMALAASANHAFRFTLEGK